jgi:hypothetical protein
VGEQSSVVPIMKWQAGGLPPQLAKYSLATASVIPSSSAFLILSPTRA